MTQTPRVLFLTTNDVRDPVRGCDRRSAQLSRHLANRFPVDVIAYDKTTGDGGTDTTPVASNIRRMVQPDYPRISAAAPFNPVVMREVFRRDRGYDVVVASAVGSFLYGLVASQYHDAPLVLDVHNVDDELSLATGDYERYLFQATVGRLALRQAALIAFTSQPDRAAHRPAIQQKSIVVANGFDAEVFTPATESVQHRLLFFGNMSYEPNIEAVERIAETIAPALTRSHPELEIHITGPDCETIVDTVVGTSNIVVAGLVDDIAAYIRRSKGVIVPLVTGSGTRLKIIEALACGTRVISTPKGAEGWPTDWTNLRIVNLEQFAAAIDELLDDPAFDESEYDEILAYSWEEQAGRLVDAVESLASERP